MFATALTITRKDHFLQQSEFGLILEIKLENDAQTILGIEIIS